MDMFAEINGVKITYKNLTADEAAVISTKLAGMCRAKPPLPPSPTRVEESPEEEDALALTLDARHELLRKVRAPSLLSLIRLVVEAGPAGARGGQLMRQIQANGPRMNLLKQDIARIAGEVGVAPESVVVSKRLAHGTVWFAGPNASRVVEALEKKEVPT